MRRLSIAVVLLALMLGVLVLAFSARNGGCLPWQDRVGYGDGALGPGQDYSACR